MGHVVVAPDKFKGSLSAPEVAAHVAAGLLRVREDLQVRQVPQADGGEGTVDAALAAGYEAVEADVCGPTGRPLRARYARHEETAVIEMAAASGLGLTTADVDSARWSSSFGTGELILHALDGGARTIVLGIGGSASTDGGAGMLAALGGRFADIGNDPLQRGGAALVALGAVDLSGIDARLAETDLILASDVQNPLLGPDGAAAVYGPQKGADPSTVAELEQGLTRLVAVLARTRADAPSLAQRPGAGAAGGLGFAAYLLGARQRPGIEVVLELTALASALDGAILVITGEGSLDEQSLFGKTPVGVAAAAAVAGVPTVAVCGRTTLSAEQLNEHGISAAYPLTDLEADVAVSMAQAGPLLETVAGQIAQEHLRGVS